MSSSDSSSSSSSSVFYGWYWIVVVINEPNQWLSSNHGAPTMYGQWALCITFQACCCPCAQVYNHNFWCTDSHISSVSVSCNCLSHAQWCFCALDDNCLSHARVCFYAMEILLKFCRNPTYQRLTHHLHDLWHSPSEGNGSSIHVLYITNGSDQFQLIISQLSSRVLCSLYLNQFWVVLKNWVSKDQLFLYIYIRIN
jgi:hypothetical protein